MALIELATGTQVRPHPLEPGVVILVFKFYHNTDDNSLKIFVIPSAVNWPNIGLYPYDISNYTQFSTWLALVGGGWSWDNTFIIQNLVVNYPYCVGTDQYNYRDASVIPDKHYPFLEQYLQTPNAPFCNNVICTAAIVSITTTPDDGTSNGTVTITANAQPERDMGFWFSIDNWVTYFKNVVGGVFEYTFTGLAAGVYEAMIKQGNWMFDFIGSCQDVEQFTIESTATTEDYGIRWKIDYQDIDSIGRSLKVYERGYAGATTDVNATSAVATVKLGEGGEMFRMIAKKQIDIEFYSESDFEFLDLFTGDPFKYKIVHEINSIADFTGYAVTDIYYEPYTCTPYPIKFTAVDNLHLLDSIDFEFINENNLNNYTKVWDAFQYCLMQTKLYLDVRLFDTSDDIMSDFFTHKIKNEWFFTDDLQHKKCSEILEGILQRFNIRLFQDENYWNLQRWQDSKITKRNAIIQTRTGNTIKLSTGTTGINNGYPVIIEVNDYIGKFNYVAAGDTYQLASGETDCNFSVPISCQIYYTNLYSFRIYNLVTGAMTETDFKADFSLITKPNINNLRELCWLGNNQSLEIQPGAKSLSLTSEFGYKDNILLNNITKDSDWIGATTLKGWGGTATIYRRLEDVSTKEYSMYIQGNKITSLNDLAYLKTTFIALGQGIDKFKLSFEFMVESVETDVDYKWIYWGLNARKDPADPNYNWWLRVNRTNGINGWYIQYNNASPYQENNYQNRIKYTESGKWENYSQIFGGLESYTANKLYFDLILYEGFNSIDNGNHRIYFKNFKLELTPFGVDTTNENITVNNEGDFNYLPEIIELKLGNVLDYANADLVYKNHVVDENNTLVQLFTSTLLNMVSLPYSQAILYEYWYYYQQQRRVLKGTLKSYQSINLSTIFMDARYDGIYYMISSYLKDDKNNTYEVELIEMSGFATPGTPDILYFRLCEDFRIRQPEASISTVTRYRKLEYE